jgi:hypothetical protein
MKKLVVFLLILNFVSSVSYSQLSGGGSAGFFTPLGETAGDTQFGLALMGRFAVSDEINVGLNFGYYQNSQSVFGMQFTAFSMPVALTAEYLFSDNEFRPYGSFDLGLYTFGVRGSGNTNSSSYLAVAPGVGGRYALSRNLDLDVSLKYHLILRENNNASFFGTNIGLLYAF